MESTLLKREVKGLYCLSRKEWLQCVVPAPPHLRAQEADHGTWNIRIRTGRLASGSLKCTGLCKNSVEQKSNIHCSCFVGERMLKVKVIFWQYKPLKSLISLLACLLA